MTGTGNGNDGADAPPARIRVVLVGALPLMRASMHGILGNAERIDVVGEAATAEDSLGCIRALGADVVVMDARLGRASGAEAVDAVLTAAAGVQVVVLSLDDDPVYESRAFAAGARGYVLAQAAHRDLVSAVRAVAEGSRFGLAHADSRA
ncbi:MAG TPA: response regulator transcription factor [Gaiellaceae bacterium]|nr:response regulator transcription factor [Gaiellaceae bacterium]